MLLEFYGKECPHCVEMQLLVEKLEKDTGVEVDRYEVWYSEENAKKMEQYDKGLCGGVPFFFNTDTNEHLCGSTSYNQLKEWAEK
tara:strand:- start:771 stop:1025 length:255 start_codon:yes stop_codon:yes gene_type:complete